MIEFKSTCYNIKRKRTFKSSIYNLTKIFKEKYTKIYTLENI